MPRKVVPKDAFDTACDEFQRQLRAWEEDEAHDDDDCCGIRVVIARGVTEAMFKRIPESWLKGLVVTLSANGDLELMDVEGEEHHRSKTSAGRFLDLYTEQQENEANGFMAYVERSGVYGAVTLKPDGVLEGFPNPRAGVPPPRHVQPLVVVEIEVHHLSVLEIIDKARQYLVHPHVQRVVVFKFFRARAAGFRRRPRVLLKAALAVVFERVGNIQPGQLARIGVVDEMSFGTAPLADRVLADLSTVPNRTSPVGRIRPIAASHLAAISVEMRDVRANLVGRRDLNVAVDAPGVNAALPFDLTAIFKAAATGWITHRRG